MAGRTVEERVTDLESSMAVLAKLPAQFDAFRVEVLARFEQVDARFEQIDRRFEQIDRRFEQIDERLAQVDARFTQMDRRFEQLEGRLDHIDVRLQEWDDRFTRLEQRISSESEHLYGRMRMLHGELIDRIRLGREGPHGDEPKSPRRRKRLPKR
jgi:chromosome segregation ATPase